MPTTDTRPRFAISTFTSSSAYRFAMHTDLDEEEDQLLLYALPTTFIECRKRGQ